MQIFFLRHWIIATSTPWIAGSNSFQREPAALERPIFADGLDTIVGTGGRIAASAPDERRQRHLVESDEPYHNGGKTFTKDVIQFSHSFGFPKQDLFFEKQRMQPHVFRQRRPSPWPRKSNTNGSIFLPELIADVFANDNSRASSVSCGCDPPHDGIVSWKQSRQVA